MLKRGNNFSYEIREADAEDWKPAMSMVWRTFLKYEGRDYTPEGIKNFWDFINDEHLYQAFLNGNYRAWVAADGRKIIGFASMRNRNLLSLLFVDDKYHHYGVGTDLIQHLCEYLKQEMKENCMTVNAAPFALGFYEKNGFVSLGAEERHSGIRVTAMKKDF